MPGKRIFNILVTWLRQPKQTAKVITCFIHPSVSDVVDTSFSHTVDAVDALALSKGSIHKLCQMRLHVVQCLPGLMPYPSCPHRRPSSCPCCHFR